MQVNREHEAGQRQPAPSQQGPRQLLVIAGAPKCATTSLFHVLRTHPQIRPSTHSKEPKFFTTIAQEHWTGPNSEQFLESTASSEPQYFDSFLECGPDDWGLDASTDYLWRPESPAMIRAFAEDREVRVVVVLRDPIDRAFSEYGHTLRDGYQKVSFRDSLDKEDMRAAERKHPLFYHRRRSAYADGVDRFREMLGDRLMIVDYSDVNANLPDTTLRILSHCGLEAIPVQPTGRHNATETPMPPLIGKAVTSTALRAIARKVIPKSRRSAVYRFVRGLGGTKVSLTEADADYAYSLMAEEIETCRSRADIPTDNWLTVNAVRSRLAASGHLMN